MKTAEACSCCEMRGPRRTTRVTRDSGGTGVKQNITPPLKRHKTGDNLGQTHISAKTFIRGLQSGQNTYKQVLQNTRARVTSAATGRHIGITGSHNVAGTGTTDPSSHHITRTTRRHVTLAREPAGSGWPHRVYAALWAGHRCRILGLSHPSKPAASVRRPGNVISASRPSPESRHPAPSHVPARPRGLSQRRSSHVTGRPPASGGEAAGAPGAARHRPEAAVASTDPRWHHGPQRRRRRAPAGFRTDPACRQGRDEVT